MVSLKVSIPKNSFYYQKNGYCNQIFYPMIGKGKESIRKSENILQYF